MSEVFYTKFNEVSGERMDPLFYSGEIKGFFSKIKYPMIPLGQLIFDIKSGIGAGKNDQSNKENGILHLRPTNIDKDGYLTLRKNIYIPSNEKVQKVKINDVLFNNTNSQEWVGKSIYIDKNIEAYFSNHITRIEVKDTIYGQYLWFILNLYQSKNIFYNLCTNWNNQSGIGIDLLKKLKIPIPNKDIQFNIIEKIEQAYQQKQQKEQEAKEKLESIDDYLLDALGIELPEKQDESVEDRVFFRKFSEVGGKRLDAPSNNTRLKFNSIYDLESVNNMLIIDPIINKVDGNIMCTFLPMQRISDIYGEANLQDEDFYRNSKGYTKFENNDLLWSKITPCMENGKSAVVRSLKNNIGFGSTEYYVFRSRSSNVNIDYIHAFFRLKILREEAKKFFSGSAGHQRVSKDFFKLLRIPLPPIEKQIEIVNDIQRLRSEAKNLKEEATQVYNEAKAEVERIILGEEA